MHDAVVLFGPVGIEVVVVIGIVVFLFGANKLPQLASSLGRSTKEYERGRKEIEHELRKNNNNENNERQANSTSKVETNRDIESLQDDVKTTTEVNEKTGRKNKSDRDLTTEAKTGIEQSDDSEMVSENEDETDNRRGMMKHTRPVRSQE